VRLNDMTAASAVKNLRMKNTPVTVLRDGI
jgi:hypothetical protein